MKKLELGFSLSFIILCFLTQTGCATMDRSECQVANWQIIGMEDGAAGRPSSYIGNHRSACAEHGIAPNLQQYLVGHNEGLKQYCTYDRGLSLGRSGGGYNGVCPANLSKGFKRGFNKGHREYLVRSKIASTKSELDSLHRKLQQIETDIQKKEAQLIAQGTSVETRRALLVEIRVLREEKEDIERELPVLESELFRLEEQYARLRR
ncbi:DUF2799 domain-containing protein [Aliikangiella sp. G2MR2-5]|uniref:DUF2799 domain-containing protein n=1 Tax=Aliikangiella sp. G2MR2-5 TaxID=2788943 RepID=UPI0018AB28FB|nr:DUF2799 domain-containing protein [Aliikangiella sp. G2MR2-5]